MLIYIYIYIRVQAVANMVLEEAFWLGLGGHNTRTAYSSQGNGKKKTIKPSDHLYVGTYYTLHVHACVYSIIHAYKASLIDRSHYSCAHYIGRDVDDIPTFIHSNKHIYTNQHTHACIYTHVRIYAYTHN